MILQISADAKQLIRFSDEPLHTTIFFFAKTSKTGLKLHQKLLLIPSPERTGYRKRYLAGRLTGASRRVDSAARAGGNAGARDRGRDRGGTGARRREQASRLSGVCWLGKYRFDGEGIRCSCGHLGGGVRGADGVWSGPVTVKDMR